MQDIQCSHKDKLNKFNNPAKMKKEINRHISEDRWSEST